MFEKEFLTSIEGFAIAACEGTSLLPVLEALNFQIFEMEKATFGWPFYCLGVQVSQIRNSPAPNP